VEHGNGGKIQEGGMPIICWALMG